MFETEAEENGFGIGCTVNPTVAWQKGAEFGYNKAITELEQQLNKKAFIISQLETQLEMVESENKKLRAKLKEI